MAKKINPKDQTKKISEAKWAFLQRNDKAKKEYEELEMIRSFREWHEKARKKEAELLKTYPEMKATYDKLGFLPIEECDELLKDSMCFPSVIEGHIYMSWVKVLHHLGGKFYDYQELNLLWKEQILKDAKILLNELIPTNMPDETLIVSIDLTRPTETILAELNEILSKNKARLAKERPEKHRLKWLSVIDEILAVWDLWMEAGEPARQAFPVISKRLNVPESTVRARWLKAHLLIYNKPYETDPVKRRDQRTDKALELCLKCTNPVCGNKYGGDEIGCPAYEKIAGKNTPRERTYEKFDMMADRQSYKSYFDPEEYDESEDN
jgi:hypothetical protein